MVLLLSLAGFGALGFLVGPTLPEPQERSFTVVARRYGYDPAVIRVNRGDTVRLRFVSEDVVHGFYLEGHDLDVRITPMRSTVEVHRSGHAGQPEVVEEIIFRAEREGKFRYRCSQTCGFMHPFMLGDFVVRPNRLLPTSIGLAVGLLVGGFVLVLTKGDPARAKERDDAA
jgi:heme/copper-type cytochrome/quinol oxidase subunit 2